MKNIDISNLPKRVQRVLIAKDVLLRIGEKKYVAKKETYVSVWNASGYDYINKTLDNVGQCNVCAVGASILSITRYKNVLIWDDVCSALNVTSSKNVRKLLASVFSPRQLLLIELAFEGLNSDIITVSQGMFSYSPNRISFKEKKKIENFYHIYPNDNERLKKIMENIIRNKGNFVL